MILYSAPSSYYSMIARLALYESVLHFEIRDMDIHLAKEQLSPWYAKINPNRTVPALVDEGESLTDSRAILKLAADHAGNQWLDNEAAFALKIEHIVTAHYDIPIEKLTFGKFLLKYYSLRKIFPQMLKRIIKKLEIERLSTNNCEAIDKKIKVNKERLAYFTEGNPLNKFCEQKEKVQNYLELLTPTNIFLFGNKMSSADIVTTVLFARLAMIDELDLIKSKPLLMNWFERMKNRESFQKADLWLQFNPLKIILGAIGRKRQNSR